MSSFGSSKTFSSVSSSGSGVPAPCSCPSGLAGMYTVTAKISMSGPLATGCSSADYKNSNGTAVTVSGTPCFWQSIGTGKAGCASSGVTLSLSSCSWVISIGAWANGFSDSPNVATTTTSTTGTSPRNADGANYPDINYTDGGGRNMIITNIVVS